MNQRRMCVLPRSESRRGLETLPLVIEMSRDQHAKSRNTAAIFAFTPQFLSIRNSREIANRFHFFRADGFFEKDKRFGAS